MKVDFDIYIYFTIIILFLHYCFQKIALVFEVMCLYVLLCKGLGKSFGSFFDMIIPIICNAKIYGHFHEIVFIIYD